MLTRILPEAHESIPGVRDALRIFWERKVEPTLFTGDIIHSDNCYAFQGLVIPIKLVCGNNDGDRDGPAREFSCRGGVAGDGL